jgi:RNA polymerase sigma-70 factor (ECF subfamily)
MDEDRELVRKTLRGNKKAFEMIVQKYQYSLFNYIGRMVNERELAIDFSQEVFLKAYSSLRSFQPQYKFSTWLFKIASNCVIDYWRKKKLPVVSLDQIPGDDADSPPLQVADDQPSVIAKIELAELKRKIDAALARLPVSLRELFIWRHVNGFSYEEMAEIKGAPVGTVKNKVFQAKEMIRKIMEEEQ